ncbi:hypothetical protein F5887DRAFT_985466 [Amanita rubescens]|nr:hypothetical protein F5887DRAFT_985466 [Amanita rubescens]
MANMPLLNLTNVGLTNEAYSTQQESIIRQALKVAEGLQPNAEIMEKIARYKRALAPHKKLPEDVLRHIFTLLCEDDPIIYPNPPAVALSYVCSAWRCIVLQMPHLWISVQVIMEKVLRWQSSIVNSKNNHKIRLAKMWLSRGGSLPRLLVVRSTSSRIYEPIKQLILPHPYRRLELSLYWMDLRCVWDIQPEYMMPLEILKIDCYFYLHPSPEFTLPLQAKMPNLTHLSLDRYIRLDFQTLGTNIPWHQLISLRLDSPIPFMTCLNVILRQGLTLTSCYLHPDANPDSTINPDLEPLVLPRILTIELCCYSFLLARAFDRWVETPNSVHRVITPA